MQDYIEYFNFLIAKYLKKYTIITKNPTDISIGLFIYGALNCCSYV
jgi:hypothetical protein